LKRNFFDEEKKSRENSNSDFSKGQGGKFPSGRGMNSGHGGPIPLMSGKKSHLSIPF